MWMVSGNSLSMAENDYGIQLPVTVNGVDLGNQDSIKITIKDRINGTTVLEKEYTEFSKNTFNLELTEQESALFSVGAYVYSLDWFQNGSFMCNIVPSASFRVVDKA